MTLVLLRAAGESLPATMSIMIMSAKNLRSFEYLLSNRISVDDTSWIFDVPSLSPADVANQANTTVLIEDISEIISGDYIFTDGCGLIARKFAQELARRARIVFRDRKYTPSVFQLRYRG